MSKANIFILIGLLFALLGCDAIRVVQVTNKTKNSIELRTDFPHYVHFKKDTTKKYIEVIEVDKDIQKLKDKNQDIQIDTITGGLKIILQPLQSFYLAGHIGPALIKIQPWELNYSTLKIVTKTDTIIANNKVEIINLCNNQKTKYEKKLDKKDIKINNMYWKNIVIRK